MEDHDQRLKTLIQELFEEFLFLFFDVWAARFKCDQIEWLTQEVFPDPPVGSRHLLDLVAKLATREPVPGQRHGEAEQWLALVHLEIESPDRAKPVRHRMFEPYSFLRGKYRMPVLPIALFLQVGLEGIGVDIYEEFFWEFRAVHFEYLYVGLPALDAIEYVEGENLLGVALAALMKIPKGRAAWLGAEALRRIAEAPVTDQKRFLLAECVQAYLPLDEEQQREFERIVQAPPYGGVKAMNTTWYEKGMEKGIETGLEKGIEKGIEKERRRTLVDLLEGQFGPLESSVLEMLDQTSSEQLPSARRVARAKSLQELGLKE